MNLRTVSITRYVTPLREGGSLPAIVEADDDGTYVLKFLGAGQGAKALIAELVVGEIARILALRVPELVLANLDVALGRAEPDPEIQDLIRASEGLNLALDYLPGSISFDPLSPQTVKENAALASSIVWLDALCTNVDRTPRNTNMLIWNHELWLIDHGAALYFHHGWNGEYSQISKNPFPLVREHVLLPFADALEEADAMLAPLLTREVLSEIIAAIPDEWLGATEEFADATAQRAAYLNYFMQRLEAPRAFAQEAIDAKRRL